MYVIVEIQGQQFKAEAGKKLFVHHIQNVENGATVEFDKVLLVDKDGDITVGVPTVEGAKVVCEVLSPLVKGDKVLVFHKKRRKEVGVEGGLHRLHQHDSAPAGGRDHLFGFGGAGGEGLLAEHVLA
ncbi:MAG TPA: 50S ribosomal protein L21, partial [Candidatus Bacteroides intestinavium]|nr:50S ribosomal protein L21 [Candidatus Bacteroides intestinavium]